MDLTKISTAPLKDLTVAILGYGNQGRAQALNLRDSGVSVVVGARPGREAHQKAEADGFAACDFPQAIDQAEVLMFLLPDLAIGPVIDRFDLAGKYIGFAHGYAYHFDEFRREPNGQYFLVGPKGAGSVLRERYRSGQGLPMVYAISEGSGEQTEKICLAYAKLIGAKGLLIKTTFQEETECDLFGEQAVLCGGLLELMEASVQALTRRGFSSEMAFLECCYEVKTIIELFLQYGPSEMCEKISPTALYGGATRGGKVVGKDAKEALTSLLDEIQDRRFSSDWTAESKKGFPSLSEAKERWRDSILEVAYRRVSKGLERGELESRK